MNNCQIVDISTFKNIFLDLPVATNKLDKGENVKKTISNKVSLAIRRTFSDKKKNKA